MTEAEATGAARRTGGRTETGRPHAAHTRRRRAPLSLALFVIALLGAYVTACVLAPLPAPDIQLLPPSVVELPAGSEIERAVEAQTLPSAAGWQSGEAVWANDDTPYPIASLTKLVTALVGLEHAPLGEGDEGATYVWTADDVAFQETLIDLDGVAFPIPEGTEVSQRNMVTLAMLPSANDFAVAYARSVFGTNEAFVEAVEEWREANGLESLVVEEPSGMSAGNLANASDLVRIARLALSNPVLAELMQQRSAELPWGIGVVENTNPLLGVVPGTVGLKTGFTEEAGHTLISAAQSVTGERELTGIAVVLGRDTEAQRDDDSRALLEALAASPKIVTVLEAGAEVGSMRGADDSEVKLTTLSGLDAVLAPGERATLAPEMHSDGTVTVSMTLPPYTVSSDTHQTGELLAPGFWWRVTHPAQLFGL